jgi:hypothetical protein
MLAIGIYLGVALVLTPESQQTKRMECLWGEQTAAACNDGNVWNGYWFEDKVFVPGLPSIESWYTPAPVWFYSAAVWYDPYVMEGTAEWRGLDLTGYVDGIALLSPADIGLPVWLKRPGHDWEGPFLVVDSAMRGHFWPYATYIKEGLEVGHKTAAAWGMVDDNGEKLWRIDNVQVSKVDPQHLGNFTPVNYQEWFVENFEVEKDFNFGTPLYEPPSTWRINGEWVTFYSPNVICEVTMC